MIGAIFMAVLLTACGGESDTEQASYPTEIPKGQMPDSIRPSHYQLDLKIIPVEAEFDGVVTIDLTFDVATDFMWMHGQDMTVSSAELTLADGRVIPATYEQVDPTGLLLLTGEPNRDPRRLSLLSRMRGAGLRRTR